MTASIGTARKLATMPANTAPMLFILMAGPLDVAKASGVEAVFLQTAVELRAGDAEQAGGPGAVIPGLLERLHDHIALHRLQTDAAGRKGPGRPGASGAGRP